MTGKMKIASSLFSFLPIFVFPDSSNHRRTLSQKGVTTYECLGHGPGGALGTKRDVEMEDGEEDLTQRRALSATKEKRLPD